MQPFPLPENEPQRIRSLHALELLDTEPDERFNRLTRLAQRLFDTPIALLSLVDSDRQWFKSRVGLDIRETPREASFCTYAIMDDDVLVVPDATADDRFRDHPLVVNLPEIRFYAGCPVKAPDGSALGTLCVIDHEPRNVSEEDTRVLRDLAQVLEQELKSLSLATMDELTGLANRRGFDAIAAHTIAMCDRTGQPATLLLFDLNDFKQINDRLGHLVGDEVLNAFAGHLEATFRDSDVVARFGGDEFCVLLSGATVEDVKRPLTLLEELLQRTDAHPHIVFSVGAAAYDPKKHDSIRALVDEADARMYRQKRSRKGEAAASRGGLNGETPPS